jgi:hypothetical protein
MKRTCFNIFCISSCALTFTNFSRQNFSRVRCKEGRSSQRSQVPLVPPVLPTTWHAANHAQPKHGIYLNKLLFNPLRLIYSIFGMQLRFRAVDEEAEPSPYDSSENEEAKCLELYKEALALQSAGDVRASKLHYKQLLRSPFLATTVRPRCLSCMFWGCDSPPLECPTEPRFERQRRRTQAPLPLPEEPG